MTEAKDATWVEVRSTPTALDATDLKGQLCLVLSPLALYVFNGSSWDVLGATSTTAPAGPATETALGSVELATEAEVQAGSAGVLVATAARLKAELDRRDAIPGAAATETARGTVELATAAEILAGTTGALAVTAERLKPEAWIAPTLINGWLNFGTPYENAGYYKDPLGTVWLRGTVKSGTVGTSVFTLGVGYRPANELPFVTVRGSDTALSRIVVKTAGGVEVSHAGANAEVSLNGIAFRAA